MDAVSARRTDRAEQSSVQLSTEWCEGRIVGDEAALHEVLFNVIATCGA